ncbi:hypothetical protein [Streptomyces malaysiense]|uniref:hypothetical protein n=1 Tax=Streptomyces malaysiense TaxID=1428626 RepID=UPI00116097B4|nr:hypothetical protein [Streptomyces malaysiense]
MRNPARRYMVMVSSDANPNPNPNPSADAIAIASVVVRDIIPAVARRGRALGARCGSPAAQGPTPPLIPATDRPAPRSVGPACEDDRTALVTTREPAWSEPLGLD